MDPNYNPGDYNPTDNDNIDFKRYLSLFISNWYWFAIAVFISLSIAYGINRWSEKIYTVSSTLLIKDEQFGEELQTLQIFSRDLTRLRTNRTLRMRSGY